MWTRRCASPLMWYRYCYCRYL